MQGRIAHGLLIFSVATGLLVQTGFAEGTNIAFTSIAEWKFKTPVKIGDTIHAIAKVKQTRAVRAVGGGFVIFTLQVANQRHEVVQEGELSMIFRSKPA
jgi:acyl dehydratase